MADEPTSLHLTYEEAERVAAHLQRMWVGMTGQSEAPAVERIADVFQVGLRKAREIVAARPDQSEDTAAPAGRMNLSEKELPY